MPLTVMQEDFVSFKFFVDKDSNSESFVHNFVNHHNFIRLIGPICLKFNFEKARMNLAEEIWTQAEVLEQRIKIRTEILTLDLSLDLLRSPTYN